MSNKVNNQPLAQTQPMSLGGLPVRTNLRAGSAWDEIGDQAKALWSKLTSAMSSTASSAPSASAASAPATPATPAA